IKGWQSRRLARQAFAMIDQKQWSEANAKARDAYLLCPSEPEAWRAIARLLSRTGQGTGALEWWKKVDEEHRLTLEDRRDFAKAALAAGELTTAATQIDQLLAQRVGPQPVDILLGGQLAARRNDALLAVDYAQRTLADKRTKPYDILSAAVLVLSVTRTDSPPRLSAWKRIEDLARDPQNAASLDSLVFLAQQQSLAPSRVSSGDISLSPGAGGPAARQPAATIGLLEIADALEKHPDARPYHQLLALQLRAQHDPALTDQYVADAVERFGRPLQKDFRVVAPGSRRETPGSFSATH
ncbi:MAG: hypothetical protein DMG96_40345, partial [Acidobacteria bacterium]